MKTVSLIKCVKGTYCETLWVNIVFAITKSCNNCNFLVQILQYDAELSIICLSFITCLKSMKNLSVSKTVLSVGSFSFDKLLTEPQIKTKNNRYRRVASLLYTKEREVKKI